MNTIFSYRMGFVDFSYDGYVGVDFVKVAEALGATGMRATNLAEFEDALKKAIEMNKPVVIECLIDQDDKVWPMVAAGQPLETCFDKNDLENK